MTENLNKPQHYDYKKDDWVDFDPYDNNAEIVKPPSNKPLLLALYRTKNALMEEVRMLDRKIDILEKLEYPERLKWAKKPKN
ncbi:MAG: hypothetical protein ACREQ5_39350 [Candidatus Dormibacteria bacterium]